MIRKIFSQVQFTRRFYLAGGALVVIFALGFPLHFLYRTGQVLLAVLTALTVADALVLFQPGISFRAVRKLPRILGLGDDISVELLLHYAGTLPLRSVVIDELPLQFQDRHFAISKDITPGMNRIRYTVKPASRGLYKWGNLIVLCESTLGLIKRRISRELEVSVPVYPSVLQMRQVELRAFSRVSYTTGSKKLKKIGQSYEFEQITPFVEGDDYRNINWKATGKIREVMVNQFMDERSQNVYCIISKGRAMKLAFNGMTIMDYAINASLALSNVALKKYDKVGLITFSDKIGTALRADNRHGQLQKILEALYNESERDLEPSYELLYRGIDRIATNRSLLLLFANFETLQMLERVLPILRQINKKHLLTLLLFKDPQITALTKIEGSTVDDIYRRTLAQQHLSDREEILYRLTRNGIQTLLTYPEQLSVNTINKYIELKSRGMI